MKRITGLLLACVIVFGIGPLRAEDVLVGSVKKLPGCGDLPARMAKYYKPVKVDVKPAAPQYKLPLDLTKLTNADFAGKIHELRNKAVKGKFDAALTASGFAAMAGGRSDDVAGFYNSVKQRGLPVFITSDSLLHLYHIQFGETLKAIEEREFFNDATLISKAIQAEALKLYKSTDGELKEAARLGGHSFPDRLRGRGGSGTERGQLLARKTDRAPVLLVPSEKQGSDRYCSS
jgi:hypothetical protein